MLGYLDALDLWIVHVLWDKAANKVAIRKVSAESSIYAIQFSVEEMLQALLPC